MDGPRSRAKNLSWMAKYGYFPTFLGFPIFWYSPLFPDARSQNFEQQFHPENHRNQRWTISARNWLKNLLQVFVRRDKSFTNSILLRKWSHCAKKAHTTTERSPMSPSSSAIGAKTACMWLRPGCSTPISADFGGLRMDCIISSFLLSSHWIRWSLMAKRYLLNKKNLKNQNLDLRCCAVNCCMEKLWRSRWKTVLKLPLSDAKPVSSSLPFTSQAARIKYGAPAGKSADAAFLRSTLNPSLPSFLACFFSFCFPFLSLPNLSPSSSFEFFRSFPFSVLLGTLPSSIPSFLYFYLFIPAVLSLDPMKPYGETLSSQ